MEFANSDLPLNQKNSARKSTSAAATTTTAPASTGYSSRRLAARNASKAISASTFEKSLETFNPDHSQREKRKLNKRLNSYARRPAGALFDDKGKHISTGIDLCDCLTPSCPGCWFECLKCTSTKCGVECRVFRKYLIDSIEYHGYDKEIRNPLI